MSFLRFALYFGLCIFGLTLAVGAIIWALSQIDFSK